MAKEVVLFLLSVAVILTSGKQIEDKKSRLILEFDWPEPKKNLQRFPHAASCSHFYAIRHGGGEVLKQCPSDELFDYRTLRCRQKAEAKCWSDILEKGNSKKKVNNFKCPFPWGLYPDTEDCSMFYDCLGGVPYSRKCPDNFLFDNAERTCVEAKDAMCADHNDVVEAGYKCPYKWGFFTHSKDCSKYYECLRKIPNLRTCKKNMLFDNFERRCLPADGVKCGDRLNPYVRQWVTNGLSTGHQGGTTERNSNGNEWKTSNHISTEHPQGTTNRFSTGRPRGTTNRFSTGRPWETTNRFSTGRPWETTNRFSTGRPWETTNRFSTEHPRLTTDRNPSGSELASIPHIIPSGGQSETIHRFSTEQSGLINDHFSTKSPIEKTDRNFSGSEKIAIDFTSSKHE